MITTIRNEKINFKDNDYICFFKNYEVSSGYLNGNQTIQGLDYRDNSRIDFWENGRVCSGYLKDIQNIYVARISQNINCKYGVSFTEDGILDQIEISGDTNIRGVSYKDGNILSLKDDGEIKKIE